MISFFEISKKWLKYFDKTINGKLKIMNLVIQLYHNMKQLNIDRILLYYSYLLDLKVGQNLTRNLNYWNLLI